MKMGIGAGLSGINMACQLQRQLSVYDYVVYDRADELGGANEYRAPGMSTPHPGSRVRQPLDRGGSKRVLHVLAAHAWR
jgi:glycine/D-amino acid oxidase-like deaminating enzyme